MHVTFSTADYIAYQHVRLVHVAPATLQEPWLNLDSLSSLSFLHLDVENTCIILSFYSILLQLHFVMKNFL